MPAPSIILIDSEIRSIAKETDVPAQIRALRDRICSGDITGNRDDLQAESLRVALLNGSHLPGTVINGVTLDADHLYLTQLAPGDINGVAGADLDDYLALVAGMQSSGEEHCTSTGDCNLDGKVCKRDFDLVRLAFECQDLRAQLAALQ